MFNISDTESINEVKKNTIHFLKVYFSVVVIKTDIALYMCK